MIRINNIILLAALISIVVFCSCYTKTDGCLDVSAENFDATADNNCCCKYPSVNITLYQKLGLLTFNSDSIYADINGDSFQLNEFRFFLSNFSFSDDIGEISGISDTLEFSEDGPANLIFTDDILLIEHIENFYEVGTFKESGLFKTIEFDLGLTDALISLEPSDFSDEHIISKKGALMKQGDDFIDGYLSFIKNPKSNPDTLILTFPHQELRFEYNDEYEFEAGADINLSLTIDIESMLLGVAIKSDTEEQLKSKIVTNLSSCFKLAY